MNVKAKPAALVIHAAGTNRDPDAARALSLAGAEPRIAGIRALREGRVRFSDFRMLVVPGGFSYADSLGAGKLLALDLASYFEDEMREFVAAGKPVIGICNGFQALVKAGILPGPAPQAPATGSGARPAAAATLAHNAHGRFECRWVVMRAEAGPCIWTGGIEAPVACPVAHGEGRFLPADAAVAEALLSGGLVALRYATPSGQAADGAWPWNPNGSWSDAAGICNPAGNVLGLMPHPENNIETGPGARAFHGGAPGAGLALFANGVRHAAEM